MGSDEDEDGDVRDDRILDASRAEGLGADVHASAGDVNRAAARAAGVYRAILLGSFAFGREGKVSVGWMVGRAGVG